MESSPHGAPWSTSFHASRFPGNPDTACARQALYGLLNIPEGAPVNQHNRAIMDAGKALEQEYVSRWEEDGVLLSRPPTDQYQTGFKDEEYWLTGNLDAVIRPEGWSRGHVVEIKGKDHEVITEMKYGRRSYDEQHYYQLQAYLGFLQENSFVLYDDYYKRKNIQDGGLSDVVDSGSILYVSRQRPRYTHEFTFDFEPAIWDSGVASLLEWKNYFIKGELPPRNPDWKWLDQPCKYCPFKRICKLDDRKHIDTLVGSHATREAKKLRPKYNYSKQRTEVLKRWSEDDKASPNN